MYFHENVYDLDYLSRFNMHIHTSFSGCAKPEMTVQSIVEAAESAGLEMIALTDHYNDDIDDTEYARRISVLKAQAAEIETPLRLLFGSELSAYAVGKSVEGDALRASLDYRLYAANHYHLDYWEQPSEKTPRGYALHALANVGALISADKADCIAHPLIGGYVRCLEEKNALTRAITDEELGDLLTLAVEHETAFELNIGPVLGDPDFSKRLWSIGREVGVCFNIGSDAHRLVNIDLAHVMPDVKRVLEG